MITVVLASIVVALLAANAAVYLRPKKMEFLLQKARARNGMLDSVAIFGNNHNGGEITKIKRELTLVRHKTEKNASRIDFAFKKINRIEGALTKNDHTLVSKEELYKKIEKLEDFRREALIAIEAMKQYLRGQEEKKQEEEDKELEERIRRIVFRGKQS